MKKIKKICIVLLITLFIVLTPSYQVYAIGDIISGADGFITTGEGATTADNGLSQESVINMSNQILGVLIPVGAVVAVLMAAYLGIKFMTGSAEEQAKVKEMMTPYIVGCIVVFGAFTIWKLVVSVLSSSLT